MILARLRDTLDTRIAEALDGRRRIVILDAPAHRNAGDLLILRGTLDVLRRLRVRVQSIEDWSLTAWSRLASLAPGVAVLLNGGGNFGGLYPGHDDYRGRVLATLPDPRAAVVMPQSVHFPDQPAQVRARHLYGQFPMATFLVRDLPSLRSLRGTIPQLSDSVKLCPDAAFGASLSRAGRSTRDVFILQRQDAESTGADLQRVIGGTSLDVTNGDWPSFDRAGLSYRALRRLMTTGDRWRHLANEAPGTLRGVAVRGVERSWRVPQHVLLRRHTGDHVEQVRETVGRGRVLVTDRLHGHVAASLMGVPNVVLNNADGKVEALVDAWTRDLSTTHFARDGDEARKHVLDIFNAQVRGQSPRPDG